MATQTLDRLLYQISLDTSSMSRNLKVAQNAFANFGQNTSTLLQRTLGREFAKTIDPKITNAQLNKIIAQLKAKSPEAARAFAQAFNRRQAQAMFKPFIKEADTFTGKMKAAFKGAFDIKKIAIGAAAGIGLAALARSLGQATKAVVKFSADFEFALAKVKSIAGEGFSLGIVTKDLERIATTVPQDLNTLTEALFFTITSGIRDVGEATTVLEVGAKAAVAGVTDATTSIDALTTIINAYQKDASEATHISDILFRTVDQGKVTFDALSSAIGDAASPAALLGVKFETLGAAIATMTKAGISVDQTTTALRNLFLQIAKPQASAVAAAKSIGVDLSVAGVKAAGGLVPFIKRIKELAGENINLLARIAGTRRAFRALAILASTGGDEFQKLGIKFSDLNFTAGSTERVFRTLNNTARNQFKLFKDSLNVAVKDFGDAILNVTMPAIVGLTNAMRNTDPIDDYIERLREIGASAESIKFLEEQRNIRNFKKEIKSLDAQIGLLGGKASFEASILAFTGGKAAVLLPFLDKAKESSDFIVDRFKELTTTTEGIVKATKINNALGKKIEERTLRIDALEQNKNKKSQEAVVLLKKINNEEFETFTLVNKIIAIRTAQLKLREKTGEISKEEAENAKKQLAAIDEIAKKAGLTDVIITDQEQKKADAALDSMKQKLALLGTDTRFEKNIISIGQQLAKANKEFEKFPANLKIANQIAVTELGGLFEDVANDQNKTLQERVAILDTEFSKIKRNVDLSKSGLKEITEAFKQERAKLVDELTTLTLGRQLGKQVVEGFKENLKNIKLDPVEVDVEPVDFGIGKVDPSGKIRIELDKILKPIGKSFEEFTGHLELAGFKIDQDFFDVVGFIDQGVADTIGSLFDLGNAISKFGQDGFSAFSIINAGIGLVSSLFGSSGSRQAAARVREFEQEQEEAEREAQREATQRLDEFAASIERVNQALLEGSLRDLEAQLALTRVEIEKLTNQANSRLASLQTEAAAIQTNIERLERLKQLTPEQAKELSDLRASLQNTLRAIKEITDGNFDLTDEQKKQLELLRGQQEFLEKQIKSFGIFGNSFSSLMDRLNLQFNLFDIDSPVKQLDKFASLLNKKFGANIPQTLAGLNKILQEGFAALIAGGADLTNFLKTLDLEELTADEFRRFLERVKEFAEGLNEEAGNIGEVEPIGLQKSFIAQATVQQFDASLSIWKSQLEIERLQLNELRRIAASNASVAGIAGANNFFIVRGGLTNEVTPEELNVAERKLAERASIRQQSIGAGI